MALRQPKWTTDRAEVLLRREPSISLPHLLGTASMLAAYAALATYIIWLSRNQINADGVAYIRIAQYYAGGRLDLAISSYWSPLLSWVLVPAICLKASPLWTFKVIQAVLGLCFALASVGLTKKLGCKIHPWLTASLGLLLALPMVLGPVTPDLLVTVLLTWGFLRVLRLVHGTSSKDAFVTGLLAGLCYLAKAYALPFFLLLLVPTYAIAYITYRRRNTLRSLGACLAGLALSAGPWILIISVHDGAPTFSSVSHLARTWSPTSLRAQVADPSSLLQSPRQGRLTSWENPTEIPYDWPTWSPLDGWAGMKTQAANVIYCAPAAVKCLQEVDFLGLLLGGYFLAVVLTLSRRTDFPREMTASWAWACIIVPLFVSGYTLLLVKDRYLWPVRGLLLALATNAAAVLITPACRPVVPESRGPDCERRPQGWSRLSGVLLSLLLALSLSYSFLSAVGLRRGPSGQAARFNWVKDVAAKLPPMDQIACNRGAWQHGLCVAFWKQARLLGEFAADSPEIIADQLHPFGATHVLILNDEILSRKLDGSPLYRRIASCTGAGGSLTLSVFAPASASAGTAGYLGAAQGAGLSVGENKSEITGRSMNSSSVIKAQHKSTASIKGVSR
jgi:hypothetical protein